jgi:O-acetyl-ADP-ribose deacetylase (regulator of RNase III)
MVRKKNTMAIQTIKGNLISLAQEGEFDVIGHGCNCFCTMKSGIAPHMHNAFQCNHAEIFTMENQFYKGDIRKLGQIQAKQRARKIWDSNSGTLTVVNMYTQYHYNHPSVKYGVPLDEDAIRLCLRKMGHLYPNKVIGLPGLIGCGLAGGNSERVIEMIDEELRMCDVRIVFLDETKIPKSLQHDTN